MGYKIAVVGATGKVGREIIKILEERKFKVKEVVALASRTSVGKEISYGDKKILKVSDLSDYDFSGTDIAIFSAGSKISRIYVPKAAESGAIVIDNSSCFRMNKEVPLIIPEVNIEELINYKKTNIISNPNCALIQLLVALKPLDDIFELKRIVLSSYQSTSGAGKEAMDELFNHTKSIFVNQKNEPKVFQRQIAFNIIPQIGEIMKDGGSEEELKIENEAKKIMGNDLAVSATCVRIPVFIGHSLSVNAEFYEKLDLKKVKQILSCAKGIELLNNDQYMTPAEVVGEDSVYVSRVRIDKSIENGLNMWITADNLRKGAALNAVQIAEELTKKFI